MERRQRAVLGTVAAAVLLAGIAVLVSGSDDGDGDDHVSTADEVDGDDDGASTTTSSGPSSTATDAVDVTTSETTTPAGPSTTSMPASTASTSSTASTTGTATTAPELRPALGVVVEVTPHADEIVAGGRAWATVVVRNQGDAPIWWEGGGCHIPIVGVVSPAGEEPLLPDNPGFRWPDDGWDGDVDELAGWLAGGGNVEPVQPRIDVEADAGSRFGPACASDSRPTELAPGAELVGRYASDIRSLPGPLPSNGAYWWYALFRAHSSPDFDAARESGEPVNLVGSAPITVVDDAARAPSADAAVASFVDDPRLAAYVESTRQIVNPGGPPLTQEWFTRLGWSDGAWELFVHQKWGTSPADHDLVLRYEP